MAHGGGPHCAVAGGGSISPAQTKGSPKPGGPRPHGDTTPFRQKPPLSLNPDSGAHIRRGGGAQRRNVTLPFWSLLWGWQVGTAVSSKSQMSSSSRQAVRKAEGSAAHYLSGVGRSSPFPVPLLAS